MTRRYAYNEFFAAAHRSFVARATAGTATLVDGDTTRAGDGILSKSDSLVHHWRGGIFLPGVTLDQVIVVSQGYADYPRIFEPIRAVWTSAGLRAGAWRT